MVGEAPNCAAAERSELDRGGCPKCSLQKIGESLIPCPRTSKVGKKSKLMLLTQPKPPVIPLVLRLSR